QFSIPLLVNSDNLFPVDIAGRRGLMQDRWHHASHLVTVLQTK
ncbi:hypothetical protein Gpo141_00015180, partial [Globisporangium polare]